MAVFNLKNQGIKGLILGVSLLSLPQSFDLSHAATLASSRASMNFRASPNGKEIGGVAKGEKFTILKDTGQWAKIKRSNGQVGWIWNKYVQVSPKARAASARSAKSTESTKTTESADTAETASASAVATGEVNLRQASLNIRKSRTSRSRNLGSLRPGEKFEILDYGKNGWNQVRTSNGTIGYVAAKYVRVTPITKIPQKNIPVPTARPTLETASPQPPPQGRFAGMTSDDQKPNGQLQSLLANQNENSEIAKTPASSGRYAGVSSDDLIPSAHLQRAKNQPAPEAQSPQSQSDQIQLASADQTSSNEATNPHAAMISNYAPESQAVRDPFASVLRPEGSVMVADNQIEADCNDCLKLASNDTGPTRDLMEIPSSVIAQHKKELSQNATPATQTSREACYGKEILKAAKENVRSRFGNRSQSYGQCAFGVRTSLQKAGLLVGGLGHAIEYHKQSISRPGTLAPIGFKNELSKYKSAKDAPPGAILVYGGPQTPRFLRDPGHYKRGNSIINRARGTTAGSYVGHVTIKGDDGKYYTDGRTTDPAVANRDLVGIYVLKDCKNCNASIKRKCGG